MTKIPDAWRLILISADGTSDVHILSGWYGGFARGDSWNLSTPIASVVDNGSNIEFTTASGTCYICHPNIERMSGLMSNVLSSFIKDNKDTTTLKEIDFKDLNNYM